jgi:DNA-binding winged helix-turn-helix (wHTH) protein
VSVAFADFVFDPEGRELSREGAPLKVDAKLLQLLRYFVAHPGRLISKRELLEQVWEGRAVADNVLSVSVAKLRKVLGHKPGVSEFIDNSYGRGYRFVCAVRSVESQGASATSSSGAARGSSAPSAPIPLVGRGAELTRLGAALDRAEQGRGGLCLLVGEPGIGKTRLCESLERNARGRGIAIAWGRCQASEGTPPLWPFVQVLRELPGTEVADDTLRVTAETHAAPQANGHAMLSQTGLYSAVRSSHGMIDGVMQGLVRASKQQPLLVFIDDLHWADAASVRLLSYLVGELSRWPILVVATARGAELADEKGDRDLIRISSHANCERIVLTRLEREQVEQYVSAVFAREAPELSAAVYARSEGNPFFMIELLRPFMGQPEGNAVPSSDALQVSSATRGLVRDRLAHLPDDAREVLSAAAVIGHDFDLGVLSFVTGRAPHELLEALEDSLANDTVVPSEDQVGAYAFDHALIRDVLYADLPIRRRCEWHCRAGQALLKRRAGGGEVSSAELAHHFLSGLPQGEVTVAVNYAREAAAAATRVGAHADARVILRRALAALRVAVEPDPAQRSAILLELAIVERMLGDPSYHEHLAQGIELARQVRLGALLQLAGQFLSPGPGILTDVDADVVLEAAFEVLPADDYANRAIVLAHQAWTPPHSKSARKVAELLGAARELAQRANDAQALSIVRDAELFFSAGPATFERAAAIAADMERELAAHPKRVEDWRATALPVFRVITSAQRGDAVAVARATNTLTVLQGKLNNTELFWHHERLLMIQRMTRGDWSSIAGELERLRERAQRLRLWSWRAIYALDFGNFLLNTQETAADFAPLVRPEILPRETDSPNSRSIKVRALAEYGFVDDARAALQAITVENLRDLPQDRDYLAVLADLAYAACAAELTEHAAVLYELLAPYPDYFAIGISFHCQGSIAQYLGNLARVLGRPEEALRLLERGVENNRRFEALTCLVHNEIDLARLLLAPGVVQDVPRAHALLSDVAERAGAMGMRPAHLTALRLREHG